MGDGNFQLSGSSSSNLLGWFGLVFEAGLTHASYKDGLECLSLLPPLYHKCYEGHNSGPLHARKALHPLSSSLRDVTESFTSLNLTGKDYGWLVASKVHTH